MLTPGSVLQCLDCDVCELGNIRCHYVLYISHKNDDYIAENVLLSFMILALRLDLNVFILYVLNVFIMMSVVISP